MNQVQAPYIKREICAPFLLGERSGREDQATYHLSLIPQIYVPACERLVILQLYSVK